MSRESNVMTVMRITRVTYVCTCTFFESLDQGCLGTKIDFV